MWTARKSIEVRGNDQDRAPVTSEILRRAEGEYREMPGLSLTLPQAARLWGLDCDTCERVLDETSRTPGPDSRIEWRLHSPIVRLADPFFMQQGGADLNQGVGRHRVHNNYSGCGERKPPR